jgi:hypothetical protein
LQKASTASPNTLTYSSNGLFVVIIIDPFPYLSLMILKNSSTAFVFIFLKPISSIMSK